jgi:tetratricopeptide (TPR) repeat protein
MSASALKLTSGLVARLFTAITLLVVICVLPVCGQTNSAPSAQVVEMIARVRAVSPAEVASLGALPLGRRLLAEQRYSEAYELFGALLEKWPREPAVLYGAALGAFNTGHSAEAERLARTASDIYLAGSVDKEPPKSMATEQRLRGADALVLLAVILGARGADSEALKSVRRAAAIAPEHFDAQFTLGRAQYSVGDAAAAVKAFRTALALKPDDTRTLFFLATALEGAGDLNAALDAYRDLVTRQPRAAEGHLGLGVLLIKRGGVDVEKGIQELKNAVGINPNLYEAQVTLGRALLARKLNRESVEHLQRAAELAPGNPEPHYQLALAYRRLGFNDKAVEETAIVKRIHELRRGEGAQNSGTTRPNQ